MTRTAAARPKALGPRLTRWALTIVVAIFVVAVYLFLYAPLIVTALFSFNDSTVQTLPMSSLTLDWYRALFNDEQMLNAILYSLKVAVTAVTIACVVGLAFSIVQTRMRFRGKKGLDLVLASPMVTPGMVLGISLLVVFNYNDIPTGFNTIVIGHAVFIIPLVTFLVQQRLKVADPSLEQASMDCGAGYLRTFWHVTLPGVRVPLVAAALLGFTMSMDEIAVTFFLAGTEPTLPVYVWGLLRFGFTPEVNAAFTLIGGGSLLLISFAAGLLWWTNRRRVLDAAAAAELDEDELDWLSATSASSAEATSSRPPVSASLT